MLDMEVQMEISYQVASVDLWSGGAYWQVEDQYLIMSKEQGIRIFVLSFHHFLIH